MSIINGRIPAALLVTVSNGQRLRKGAPANSFRRLSDRSRAKGYGPLVIERLWGIDGGYRDIENQRHAKQLELAGKGNPAATPGTSNHGLGLAADLREPYASRGPKHSWLIARAAPMYSMHKARRTPMTLTGW